MTLSEAARRLSSALGEHGALVGGLCAVLHGVERFTRDVDAVSDLPPEQIMALLEGQGVGCTLVRDGKSARPSWSIHGSLEDVAFQVIPAAEAGVDLEQAQLKGGLRVACRRDFISSKCLAGGQQDLHDVAVLLLLDPELEDFIRESARRHGVSEKLETWLADARLRQRYLLPPGKGASV